jgi:outer membrane protein insertion porin family
MTRTIALWIALPMCCALAAQAAPTIRSVVVSGNASLPSREVLSWTNSRPGDRYTSVAVETDRRAIEAAYQELGFLAARVTPELLAMTPDSSQVDLGWSIDEGRRTLVGTLVITGAEGLSREELRTDLDTSPGTPLVSATLEGDIARLLGYCERQGYPFARCLIDSLSVRKGGEIDSIDICLRLEPGEHVTIDEIRVEGTEETDPDVVIRETRIQPGEVYDPDRVEAIRDRLNRLNIFSEVAEPELYVRGERGGLLITVREGPTNTFDGVLGYVPAAVDGAGGYLTGLVAVGMRNLFGTGRKLQFRWYRQDRYSQELMVRYTEPWVFALPLNLGGGFFQRQQDSAFVRRVVDFRGELLASERLTLGSSFESTSTIPSADTSVQRVRRSSSIALGVDLGYDSRDDLYAPQGGVYLRTDYHYVRKTSQAGQGMPEGRSSQQRLTTDVEFYLEPFTRQVVALGGHLRQITGGDLEEGDLFWMGGALSLRGYRENQFLGSVVMWANNEYRVGLARRTFLFAFFDAGYYSRPADLAAGIAGNADFLFGYGVGIRLSTGIGMLGLSVALGKDDTFAEAKVHVGLINEF